MLDEILDVLRLFGPEKGTAEIARRGHRSIAMTREQNQKRDELSTAVLPNATSKRMFSNIRETYRFIDESKENIFWVDVMFENNWTGILYQLRWILALQ